MLQFDKSIHPVVLYEYHLICMFMNIHENLKIDGKSRKKTLSLGDGVEVRSILLSDGPFKFHAKLSLRPSECETKFSIKHFGMGYVNMHGFISFLFISFHPYLLPWQPLV